MNFIKILLDLAGTIGERLKYGEESRGTVVMPMVASTVLKAKSGRFVTINTAGNAYLTSAADTTVFGSIEGGYDLTCSSVAGATKLMCNTETFKHYRIPINTGTFAATLRGVACDLSIASSVQGAALGTTTGGHVLIVDGDLSGNNKWVVVKLNAKAPQHKTAA